MKRIENIKDIATDIVRDTERLVYRPIFLKMWWYSDNSDPEVVEYASYLEAVKSIEVEGNNTPDKYFTPYNEIRVMFKEVWLDEDDDVVEEEGMLSPGELYNTLEDTPLKDEETTLHCHYFRAKADRDDEMWQNIHTAIFDMVNSFTCNEYRLSVKNIAKYSTIDVYKGDDIVDTIQLRIADHSYNPANNDTDACMGKFISVVVADTDPTLYKYLGAYNIHFKPFDDVNNIVTAVRDRIENIIENKIS